MASGWNVNVWRTDLEEEVYIGFFLDDADAQGWIDKQTVGTYDKRTK